MRRFVFRRAVRSQRLAGGNPRRHWGLKTRQERQADDRMRAELEDLQYELPLPYIKLVEYFYDTPWERRPYTRRVD